jgi:hypothetical protein
MFRKYLNIVQNKTDLIPDDHDVDAFYSTFFTPRKTTTTRIERAGFGHQFVDKMNRWRPQEKAQGWWARRQTNAHNTKGSVINAYYVDGFLCPVKL